MDVEYSDLNVVDSQKKVDLKRKCIKYIEAISSIGNNSDQESLKALLEEWYNNTVIYPVGWLEVAHNRGSADSPPLFSLLILQLEIHNICEEVAAELNLVFPDQFLKIGLQDKVFIKNWVKENVRHSKKT